MSSTIKIRIVENPVIRVRIGSSGKDGSTVSDVAYNSTTWNGVTTDGASKNALRDKFESSKSEAIAYAVALG